MAESTEPKKWSLQQNSRLHHLDFLAAIISLLVIQSFLSADTFGQRAVFNLLFLVMILSAIRMLSASRARLMAAMLLGAASLILSFVAEVYPSEALLATTYCSYIVILTLLMVTLCEQVFASGLVDVNRILGAICIFFVLGLTWAFVYSLIYTFQPMSFRFTTRVDDSVGIRQAVVSEFIYFSNVTLTTLGYGDIVPVSRPARLFSTLEAMLGQLYLATVIARLVGLHTYNRK